MSLKQYLTPRRVRMLKSKTRQGAFSELVRVVQRDVPDVSPDTLLRAVWERETLLSTRIAPRIAIPHVKIEGLAESLIVVGKSQAGIRYDPQETDRVQLIFMIVGGSTEHLKALGAVAALLQHEDLCTRCLNAKDSGELYALLTADGPPRQETRPLSPITEAVCDQAVMLAGRAGAQAVIVHDPPPAIEAVLAHLASNLRFIVVRRELPSGHEEPDWADDIQLPFRELNRSSRLELSLLLALSRGLIHKGDKVVSVFGLASDTLDTIVVTDVQREFSMLFSIPADSRPDDIEQQVFMRVLQVAADLAHEGREGRPVGTLFVTGDIAKVAKHCQQMVINPFKGYAEHERNILDPSLGETVKEFAHIDGAFIIGGDGVIESAGAYLRVDHPVEDLPSGLGARHAAAAAITAVSNAVAVVVSQSTRKVSLFRAGRLVMEI